VLFEHYFVTLTKPEGYEMLATLLFLSKCISVFWPNFSKSCGSIFMNFWQGCLCGMEDSYVFGVGIWESTLLSDFFSYKQS